MAEGERERKRKYAEHKGSIIFWNIFSAVLCGILGGVGFASVPTDPWYFVGIPAILLILIFSALITGKNRFSTRGAFVGCLWGCCGLIIPVIGISLFFHVHSTAPIMATIGVGVVIGALVGWGVCWEICRKLYGI